MYLVDEAERALADAARHMLGKSYTFAVRMDRLRTGRTLQDWQILAENGWLGLLAPDSLGGSGCSTRELCGVLEAFGEVLHLDPILPVAVDAATVLSACDASSRRDELLTGLASGVARPVVLRSLVLVETDGELRGAASAAPGAASATHLLIPTPEGRGLFVVTPGDATVQLRASLDGSDIADVEVHLDARAAPRIDCDRAALARGEELNRLGACAWVQGVMETAIRTTAEYVALRKQFGQPLSAFQAVRHRLADMRMAADTARVSLRRAACLEDRRSILAAYVVCLEAALKVTEDAIQLHGGMGMTDDLLIGHQYRCVLRLQASYGAPQAVAGDLARGGSVAVHA